MGKDIGVKIGKVKNAGSARVVEGLLYVDPARIRSAVAPGTLAKKNPHVRIICLASGISTQEYGPFSADAAGESRTPSTTSEAAAPL